ncbi:MAG: asparagine synthase (glutamine-hydrolyzing) [candidate division Zixibacteria bacterium]|nr:asparagine synthase (glutamine-hydrolyzing) [candidate division Zixibacteria bacterium]
MCGIAGIVSLDGKRPVNNLLLEDMIYIQSHRGPDEGGIYLDEGAGLGHARLSIIDLSTGGQPMTNEDDSLWCVYNGEVYNYLELRPELKRRGHRFRTTSDTEVLIHSFEEYGVKAFDDFNGQFAIAFWDKRRKKLTLVRDRVGIRPLHYAIVDNQLLFASEIKAILLHPKFQPQLDPQALDEVFTFWSVLPPRTMFKDIHELPPGCYLTLQDGQIEIKKYWQPDLPSADNEDQRSLPELVEELKELLRDSTIIRLRADVPVGAYLSGGLDSSATTAFIRNYTSNPLKTFSVAFEDKNYDERDYQVQLSNYLRTDHRMVSCDYERIANIFDKVIWHTEKPILRTAPAPMMMLSNLVRDNGIIVVLTGEGADEFLGGYDLFKEAKIRWFWSKNPDSKWRPLLLERLYPYLAMSPAKTKMFLRAFYRAGIEHPDNPQFSHIQRWLTASKIKNFYTSSFRDTIGDFDPTANYINTLPSEFQNWSYLAKAQFLEVQTLLSSYLLSSQGDRMAAANSIEGRYPFLDHRVIEFASKLPPKYKIKGLVEKYILRESVKGLIPEELRKRIKRPYMAPDAVSFLHGSIPASIKESIDSKAIEDAGIFNAGAVTKLHEKLKSLPSERIGFKDNMSFVGILSTMMFYDQFLVNFGKNSSDMIDKWRDRIPRIIYRGEHGHKREHPAIHYR